MLGHAQLCGALYVVYHHSSNEIRGNYMLCALFESRLLLAIPTVKCKSFEVVAAIDTRCLQIAEPDEGKGRFTLKLSINTHSDNY